MIGTKEERTNQFRQLLDLIYSDLTKPYDSCWTKDQPYSRANLTVTVEPEHFRTVLETRGPVTDICKMGVVCYTPRFYPSLTEILELLEDHPVAKRSWPSGAVNPNFKKALKILDELPEVDFGREKYAILVGDRGLKKRQQSKDKSTLRDLTLIVNPRVTPYISFMRYMGSEEEQDSKCNINLEVALSGCREIGEDHIRPYYLDLSPRFSSGKMRNSTILVGWRTGERLCYSESNWNKNLKIYPNKRQIWKAIREVCSPTMVKAVKEVLFR